MSAILRSFNPFISVLCCFLLINNQALLTRATADIPDQYTWQVERVELSTAYAANGFESGDVALAWEDIPAQFFPLEVTEVWVWWHPPPYQTPHHLAARVLLYEGATGELRYVLEHVALIRGLNRIRLSIECTQCEAIFNADEGPGVGIGIQYVTEFDYPVTSNSGHVVVDDEGCWSGTNLVYDDASAQWLDPCSFGMTGNFAIRAVFEPLCPERIGDIDGDLDIDLGDFATLQAAFTGPSADVFGDSRVCSDLNNDYAVDLDDFEIMAGTFTGSGNRVECPEFDRSSSPAPPGSSHIRAFTTEAFPHIPKELQRVPGELEPSPLCWTYTQIGVTLAVGAIVLTFVIGPCVQSGCRALHGAIFAGDGVTVDDTEQDRIRAAIDYIGNMSDDDSYWCYWWYMQNGGYNPMATGSIVVNRSVAEDNTEFGATHVLGHMTLHHTFVTGDHWDEWGVEGIVLLLFAEWQHREHTNWSEHQCQEWLMQWREDNNFEHIAPEFGHGFGD